ncbi:MAG TPA: cardiolipin synthase [Candidatus Eisenbergiella merdipullorum]|uniref:Cardiolipin synthase n=1 Tax=Candidatus Eisenbergiella merdipullorum TaxID=2838553 RepID=A0A9D2I7A0_9FIRM|nr:cardiolipin synthase [Candidatus Eisenbergiella merdipullorum]
MKDKYKRLVMNRIIITVLLLLIQIVWIVFMLEKLTEYVSWITTVFSILSILIVLYIIGKDDNSAYKIAWIILIMALPLFGGLFYLFSGDKKPSRKLRGKLYAQHDQYRKYLKKEDGVGELSPDVKEQSGRAAGTFRYVEKVSDFPAYTDTEVKYYPSGEEMFVDMLEDLKSAQHFIFLEYFIVSEGKMWESILKVLKEKAAAGVDVRMIYDDMGCVTRLPAGYDGWIEKFGIKCMAFNPVVPFFSLVMNNRDHRKILVIDGHTGYTGGINLADEYINEIVRFGYWKDTGVRLKGEGVWSFTEMFLEMWNAFRKEDEDIDRFRPHVWHPEAFGGKGLVQPYTDSPLDNETIAENVYLDILHQAKKYVYIFTPYLIVDDVMRNALCLAAKRGVDVRIVTPGIPDKPTIFRLTRSNYPPLLRAGIRIYEYTPGFIHAKSYISDDEFGVVGSVNMDFRSLYLHFECATLLYRTEGLMELKEDSVKTIGQSREITLDDCKKGIIGGLVDSVLRVFAPLC